MDDWAACAVTHGSHPLMIGFIRLRRKLLLDMFNMKYAFPTPRFWEILSSALGREKSSKELIDVLIGIVGFMRAEVG